MTIKHSILCRSIVLNDWHCLLLPALAMAMSLNAVLTVVLAEAPRVLPQDKFPNDIRLQPLKDLDGYFPFQPCPTPEAWAKRAERVRRQMQVALGLYPMPTKTPLNPVLHGKIERDSYTVEKVFFESVPGFYVTGNLYRPVGKTGRLAGVLSPHGHWSNGRFHDAGLESVRREIVQGAERFEEGGRSPLQARCGQLARMGCVVFHYDMIGYADSVQIPQQLAHGFSKQRPEMNTTESWGLFSPQAEAHLQSVMGLQTWSSIRALDFLLGLPDVDPGRIAITGASGGGTQTFILCAIDPRPALAFPAVMVSTAMQGGCTCENACLLRISSGNVEFAALFAPKPQGLTAADDWTKEMPAKGFPELKKHYAMLGAPDKVMLKPLLHFGHNYNYPSRAAMYAWINQHFKLGLKEPVVEEDYQRLTREQMSVWDEQHPKPAGGPDFERKLLRWLAEDADQQLQPARSSLAEFQKTFGGAISVLIGRDWSEVGEVECVKQGKADRGDYWEITGLARNKTYAEELPIVLLHPKQDQKRAVVWIHEHGKAGLFAQTTAGAAPEPQPEVQKLLKAGAVVVGVDLLYQGEFLADGKPVTTTRRVKNPRESAAYSFGYNHTLFAQRVHDIMTVVKLASSHVKKPMTLDLVGLGGAGPWVAAARTQAQSIVDNAVVDTGGFRFGKVLNIHDVNFLPGGAKYDDLPGLLALNALGKLWLAGEGAEAPPLVKTIYQSAGAQKNLTVFTGAPQAVCQEAVKWLLQQGQE
jgi:dienelactone hydrolase